MRWKLSHLYDAKLFLFLGVCTKSSRTSSENSEQGENSYLSLGLKWGRGLSDSDNNVLLFCQKMTVAAKLASCYSLLFLQ